MPDKYYNVLMNLSNKAFKKNEVPISALIIKKDKIIAKAYNKREKNRNILDHAEIMAIKKASKKLKTWHLDECDLYVTLKPCSMCMEVIKQSHIKNVYYLLDKPKSKKEYNNTKIVKANICMQSEKYAQILSNFFKKKRDKKKHI